MSYKRILSGFVHKAQIQDLFLISRAGPYNRFCLDDCAGIDGPAVKSFRASACVDFTSSAILRRAIRSWKMEASSNKPDSHFNPVFNLGLGLVICSPIRLHHE